MIEEELIDQEGEEEEIQEPSVVSRVLRWIVALAVLVGLVYLSGLDQYFFYQKTPAQVKQEPVASAVDAKEIVVPLSLFIVRNDESNGSDRTEENVRNLVKNASQIWEQANIKLTIQNLYELKRTDEEISLLLDSPRKFVEGIAEFNPSTIHVFFVARLRGINGLAFSGLSSVAIADYTSVYDFRALAHEIGHILGLPHVENPLVLMHQGANGFELSLPEVLRARERAVRF